MTQESKGKETERKQHNGEEDKRDTGAIQECKRDGKKMGGGERGVNEQTSKIRTTRKTIRKNTKKQVKRKNVLFLCSGTGLPVIGCSLSAH